MYIYICLCVGSNLQIDRTVGEPEEKLVHPFRNPYVVCVMCKPRGGRRSKSQHVLTKDTPVVRWSGIPARICEDACHSYGCTNHSPRCTQNMMRKARTIIPIESIRKSSAKATPRFRGHR